MPTDIAEIAESLRLDFGETARWRREKAAEHPEDSRNIEAAKLLDRLAKTIKDVDPTLLDTYGALWDDEVQDSEQHSEMLRLLAFTSSPKQPKSSSNNTSRIGQVADQWMASGARSDGVLPRQPEGGESL